MRGRRNLLKRRGESWEGFTIRKEGDANHFQNRHSSAISTHPLRKEGDDILPCADPTPSPISTHTLRKEGDFELRYKDCKLILISTHTPRKEGDRLSGHAVAGMPEFQPTPSARRVTIVVSAAMKVIFDFNPHPPQGG